MQPFFRRAAANLFRLFTRRPFYILVPILAGALIGPLLAWIGFSAETAGIMALVVIVVLMLVLGSATIRRLVNNAVVYRRDQG